MESQVSKKHLVLLVDDNKANLRLLEMTLQEEGMDVLTAMDVESAQKILLQHKDKIDLVLSDIQMPGLTGFDLVRWLKQESKSVSAIPILLITSQLPSAESRVFGLSLGAVDYMVRSLDPQELVLRVKIAIEHFEEVKRLQHSLENTESLAAAGRVLAANNHEIKNLVQVVKMALHTMDRHLNTGAGLAPAATDALKSLKKAAELLSDVSKSGNSLLNQQTLKSSSFDLNLLLHDVLGLMGPMLKRTQLQFQANPSEALWVKGSAVHLKQVLINLILNAAESIRDAAPSDGGRITVTAAEQAGKVVLAVKDNGMGLPTAEKRTDFQAFESTKQMRGGTGLGLWLSSRFIQSMAGELSLESQGSGKGATALVVLPKGTAAPAEPVFDISSYFLDQD